MTQDQITRVETTLGFDRIICDRCGATLGTYAVMCSVGLEVQCPGFLAIEEAAKPSSSPAGR